MADLSDQRNPSSGTEQPNGQGGPQPDFGLWNSWHLVGPTDNVLQGPMAVSFGQPIKEIRRGLCVIVLQRTQVGR